MKKEVVGFRTSMVFENRKHEVIYAADFEIDLMIDLGSILVQGGVHLGCNSGLFGVS